MSAKILQELMVTAEMTRADFSKEALKIMIYDLREHQENDVINALARCRRELTRPLSLPDILARLPKIGGFIGPEEAWATALVCFDESKSAIVSSVILEAMSIARPVFETGDHVAARMVFKQAYERLVEEKKIAGEPQKMEISLGFDFEGRKPIIEKAVQVGLIQMDSSLALPYLNVDDEIKRLPCNSKIDSKAQLQKIKELLGKKAK